MTSRLRAPFAALLGLLTTLALVAVPVAAQASAPTDPPKVGQCRTLSYAQMQQQTDTSDVVPCSQSHTAYTFAVPAFPDGTDLATTATSTLAADARTACEKAATPYFRGSHVRKDMALWSWAYFIPSTAQLAAGDDWIECDVVVVWPGKKLMPMPTVHKPVYVASEPKVALACRTGKLAAVPCTTAHQWHPVGGFNVKQSGYPSRTKFLADGQRCHTITKTTRYLVTWPLKSAWKAGDHAIVCSKPTTA